MIEQNELRIGNYFKDHTGRIGKVKSFFESKVTLKMEHSTEVIHTKAEFRPGLDIEPIPLSPEILEKCAFEKYYADVHYQEWQIPFMRQFDDLHPQYILIGKPTEGPEGIYFFGVMSPVRVSINNIYYLHQLQNIYWCLTGKELIYHH